MAPPAAFRWCIFFVSVIAYILCGVYNKLAFPWFVGSTFASTQMATNNLDGFEVLLISCWFLIFIANGYLVYRDSRNVCLSIAYVIGFVQYVLVVILSRFFDDANSLFVKYAPYWSATALIAVNVTVFAMVKYLMPTANRLWNGVVCAALTMWFLFIFLYETLCGSIYGAKIASKMTEMILFFSSAVFMARFASFTRKQRKQKHIHSRIDQELRRTSVGTKDNGVVEYHSSSEECERAYHHETHDGRGHHTMKYEDVAYML